MKKIHGVWLLRGKIRFGEEKQWVCEVESKRPVSGLRVKLKGSKGKQSRPR